MKMLFLLLPALASTTTFAALPPLYETLAEFQSLINSKELAAKLNSGEALETISRTSKGFVIKTNQHTLDVEVIYNPASKPGPAHYYLIFKDPQPLTGTLPIENFHPSVNEHIEGNELN